MKEQNIDTILVAIYAAMDAPWLIKEILSQDQIVHAILLGYLTNDYARAASIDYPNYISVIWYTKGISIIWDESLGRDQEQEPLCTYESLSEDIYNLFTSTDMALARITS